MKVLVGAALFALSLSQMGVAFAGNAHAQVSPDKSATSKTALLEPRTREAVQELISDLDDTQVRTLLVERMTKED